MHPAYCEFTYPDGSMCMSARRPEKRRLANFGHPGKQPRFCAQHKQEGMSDVLNKSCIHPLCDKHAIFGFPGQRAQACKLHKTQGMTNLVSTRRCAHESCTKHPAYALPGEPPKFCRLHKTPDMVDVVNDRCAHPNCDKQPSYGKFGGPALFCVTHKEPDMVHFRHWRSVSSAAETPRQPRVNRSSDGAAPADALQEHRHDSSAMGGSYERDSRAKDWTSSAPVLGAFASHSIRQLHTRAAASHCVIGRSITRFTGPTPGQQLKQAAARHCLGRMFCAGPTLRHPASRAFSSSSRSVHAQLVTPHVVGLATRAGSWWGWVVRTARKW